MKVKVTRVNGKDRPGCKCGEHFLELCTGFDGEIFSFERYCYVCGTSWVYKEGICGKKKFLDDGCPRVGALVFLDWNWSLTLKQGAREVPLKGTLDRHFIEKWIGMEYVRVFTKHVIFTGENGISCVFELIDSSRGGHCVFVVKEVLKKR